MKPTKDQPVTKINVLIEDDVNIIVDKLKSAKDSKVVLNIPEGNDLLTSRIGLTLLAQTADAQEKKLVVVTDSPSGRKLCQKVDIFATENANNINETVWQQIHDQQFNRLNRPQKTRESSSDTLKSGSPQAKEDGELDVTDEIKKENDNNIEKDETGGTTGQGQSIAPLEPASFINKPVKPTATSSDGLPSQPDVEDSHLDQRNRPTDTESEATFSQPEPDIIKSFSKSNQDSARDSKGLDKETKEDLNGLGFTVKVDNGETKTESFSKPKRKVKRREQPTPLAESPDIKSPQAIAKGTIVGRDFAKSVSSTTPSAGSGKEAIKSQKASNNILGSVSAIFKSILAIPAVFFKKQGKSSLMRFGAITLIGFMALFFIYYRFYPSVRITLYTSSEDIALEDAAKGSLDATGFDAEAKSIPILKEEVKVKGSDNIKATGKAITGDKAKGAVTLYNSDPDDQKEVPAGTRLTTSGLVFTTNSTVTVPKAPIPGVESGKKDVSVTAAQVGEEYNISAGQTFTSPINNIVAQNDAAFSGGNKEESIVLSKDDYEKGLKKLKNSLKSKAQSELEFTHQDDGYVFIKDSLSHKEDGDPKVNPSIGQKTDTAHLEVGLKSTALFYHLPSIEALAQDLLIKEYTNQKNQDLEAEASNFEIEIAEVKVDKNDKVTIKYSATASVTPQLSRQEIVDEIKGEKWPDMLNYINTIPNQQQEAKVEFFPRWLPDFLHYIPKEETRIEISLQTF